MSNEPATSAAEPLGVATLGEPELAPTARLLAHAFEVDAAYRYLFPEAQRREAGLEDFFARNLRTHLPYRCTRVALDAEGGLLGTVTLRPPGGVHISLLTMLRQGLLPFALAQGAGAVKRLLWLKRTYDAYEALLSQGRPHWYVHMMAVAPEAQGRGVGSELLDRVLDETARRSPGVDCVLTTHLERNLGFYARAGFELSWERTVEPPDAAPYPVWGMTRRSPSGDARAS